MTNNRCPQCGGKLKRHGKHRLGSYFQAYRDCRSCDYGEEILIEPEKIMRVRPVKRNIRTRIKHQPQSEVEGV